MKVKIWRRIVANKKTSLNELVGFSTIDLFKPVAICLPGISTTHINRREINGYMMLIEESLGGRSVNRHINLLSVSYTSTSEEYKNIECYNDNPLGYYSDSAKFFAINFLSFFLKNNIDINLFCKSYGSVFAGMVMNALYDMGIVTKPHQIRILVTGNIARINYIKRSTSTEIIVEGSNDLRAKKLNEYKVSAPMNHFNLTITPVFKFGLHVLSNIRNNTVVRKSNRRSYIFDKECHTVLLYYSADYYLTNLIQRVSRNMLMLKRDDFNVKSCFNVCATLDKRTVRVSLKDEIVTSFIWSAIQRGNNNIGLSAVLFDWDLTLADGENINLKALNYTFKEMKKQHGTKSIPIWDKKDMRIYFTPTSHAFFKNLYGKKADFAMKYFNKMRSKNLFKVKLIPGAKKILNLLIKYNIPIAIVSNKDNEELQRQVNFLLYEDKYKKIPIIGNTIIEQYKPNPIGIFDALDMLQLNRDILPSILFIGDKISTDIEAALAAGCKPCLIHDFDKIKLINLAKKILFNNGDFLKILDPKGREIVQISNLEALFDYLRMKVVKK